MVVASSNGFHQPAHPMTPHACATTVGWWQAFNSFDKDRSGYIESAELRGILRTVGQEVTDEELHEMMSLADSNGSGKMDVGT